ncbi:MAG: NFACT RNA binding domain-containing protein [Nanoarchaeota archaeon]
MKKTKFRNITLTSGSHVILGKNAEQNEMLVNQFKGKENIILHTAESGSPFCVINEYSPSKKDIKGTAVVCAVYSQDWRDNKNNVLVHKFTGMDVYKEKGMKTGMWGVKNFEVIEVKKQDIEKWQN